MLTLDVNRVTAKIEVVAVKSAIQLILRSSLHPLLAGQGACGLQGASIPTATELSWPQTWFI